MRRCLAHERQYDTIDAPKGCFSSCQAPPGKAADGDYRWVMCLHLFISATGLYRAFSGISWPAADASAGRMERACKARGDTTARVKVGVCASWDILCLCPGGRKTSAFVAPVTVIFPRPGFQETQSYFPRSYPVPMWENS